MGKGITERTEGYMYLVCGKEMKIINKDRISCTSEEHNRN